MLESSNQTLQQCFQKLDHIKYIHLRNKIQLVSRHEFNPSEKKPNSSSNHLFSKNKILITLLNNINGLLCFHTHYIKCSHDVNCLSIF